MKDNKNTTVYVYSFKDHNPILHAVKKDTHRKGDLD